MCAGRLSPVRHENSTREKAQDYSASICLRKEFHYRPSMRTCSRRAMCRILSLVVTLTRRPHKNDVDGAPLRIETQLRVAKNELSQSRTFSPCFVLAAPLVSSLQSDSSHSAWPRTSIEVPSSRSLHRSAILAFLFFFDPPHVLYFFLRLPPIILSIFFISSFFSLLLITVRFVSLRRRCIQASFGRSRCRGDRCSPLSILSKMTHLS